MSQTKIPSEAYMLVDWPAPDNVHAFITTRKGGVSTGSYDSLNLNFRSGDQPQHVAANRKKVIADWYWDHQPCWLHQVHGTTVVDAASHEHEPQADASVTQHINTPALIMVADCVPVLFCNTQGNCVAAAHAGWKGLAAGILENTLAAMNCQPSELIAWIGPAISQPFFEVGSEVRDAFTSVHTDAAQGFIPNGETKWLADLHFLTKQRLQQAGLTQIHGDNICVYQNKDNFFSYRRDGQKSGRMAAAIWLAGK